VIALGKQGMSSAKWFKKLKVTPSKDTISASITVDM
jgi:hypothetical protein